MKAHACLKTRLTLAALLLGVAPFVEAQSQPIAQWIFAQDAVEEQTLADTVRGYTAELQGACEFVNEPLSAAQFDGEGAFLSVKEPPQELLPSRTLSAEAWVSLNAGQAWGNLVGYFQDNGSFEKGWLLGYNRTKFTFSVSTQGKLQYLPSTTAFQSGRWYHVVGTYDGSMLRLYVNGQLEADEALRGAIDYPDSAFFSIGAYKDDNEFFPMNGLLHLVALYSEALDDEQVESHYREKMLPETVPLELELGPYVQYVTPSEAVVRWWTKDACSSILEYGLAGAGAKYSPSIELHGPDRGELDKRLEDKRPKTRHTVRMEGLRSNAVYGYRVRAKEGDTEKSTDVYELDTALNYSMGPLLQNVQLPGNEARQQRVRAVAREILLHSRVTKGYCLVWGMADGALAYELAANSNMTVLGVDEDADRVSEVRRRLYKAGVYGTRLSLQHVDDLATLPYPSNFANLIVSERMLFEGRCPGKATEMQRILCPRRGAAVLFSLDDAANIEGWLRASSVDFQSEQTSVGLSHVVKKSVPPGVGSWTHQYGDTGNTTDSHDDLGGASGTDDLVVQWLGKPGANFGADRNPRMPAPLAVSGRLFHQGMNRMVALDSYNGTILWSLEIPAMQRVNLPRDASNWCTDDAFLYLAVKDKCWVIEHENAQLERVFDLPQTFSGESHDWGYVARKDNVLFGSAVRENTIYTDFWGGDAWYDQTAGFGTEKVCSDALFAYDVETGQRLWTYHRGLVINTTVAVGTQGVFLVESRNPKLRESETRRLNAPDLWSDQYLVALNAETGEPIWETCIDDTTDGIVVFFLSCRDDAIVIASSAAGNYHLYKFDPETGKQHWHTEHKWPSDNHGGHMQHPVVLADRVFLEPCGYDLSTGHRITSAMSGREGCATYCGTKYALIHRGQSRRIAMWDFNTGKITTWHLLRPSCWLSTIAGEGMVLSPEGGGGCSCGNWLETSLAFAPIHRAARENLAGTGSTE